MNITIRGTLLDIAARGVELLKAQGECSVSQKNQECQYYHTETGNRCIIGLLVTEEEAKWLEENHSGATVEQLKLNFPDIQSEESRVLLSDIQHIHDNTAMQVNHGRLAKHNFNELVAINYEQFLEKHKYAIEKPDIGINY